MAIKPRAKGIPRVTAYGLLSSFAAFIIVSLTGNAAFATPDPAIVALTAAQTALDAAIAAWGPVGARGSHVDLMNLRSAALTMRNLLVQELGYVQSTVVAAGGDYAAQSAMMASSGFGVKNAPVPQGLLGQPENFHQNFRNNISIYFVGLGWKKPLGLTSPGNVKNYQIWRNPTNNVFNDPTCVGIGTATRTQFIDRTPLDTPAWYFITASNDQGLGAPTAGLLVAPI